MSFNRMITQYERGILLACGAMKGVAEPQWHPFLGAEKVALRVCAGEFVVTIYT